MALKKKYQELLTAALASGVSDLKVREQSGRLHIDVIAPSEDVKEKLWTLYGKIADHHRPDDVIMNISVNPGNGISNGS